MNNKMASGAGVAAAAAGAAVAPPAEPSETIVKLVLPFLTWEKVINDCERVSRRWRDASRGDDVWRPLCEVEIAREELCLRNGREHRPELVGAKYGSFEHEVLATQMARAPSAAAAAGDGRRSCREAFVLSQRMGRLISEHELYGPDAPRTEDYNDRTLRDVCINDYRWLVQPSIERLREVFGGDRSERLQDISQMKSKLLSHAQNHSVPRREKPERLKKGGLLLVVGRYVLGAATMSSVPLDGSAFVSSSPIQATCSGTESPSLTTIGEIVKGIEGILGTKIALSTTLIKRGSSGGSEREFTRQPATKKLRSTNDLHDLDWPMNPVDALSFVIREIWNWDDEALCFLKGADTKIELARKKWWSGLAHPVRKLLLTIYNEEIVKRFTDVSPIPEGFGMDGSEHPSTRELEIILDLSYPHFRKRVAEIFWRDLNPEVRGAIFNLYKKQCKLFSDAVRQNYSMVYGEAVGKVDEEATAKILLDVFLEVPPSPDFTQTPELEGDYCQNLAERMEESMNRWDQLIDMAKTSEDALWDPDNMAEILSISTKFGVSPGRYDVPYSRAYEFSIDYMVKRHLHQLLSSDDNVPRFYGMKQKVEAVTKKIKDELDQGTWNMNMPDVQEAFREFRAYSRFIHVREHAMIALIPLLPSLSEFDSKRLVYAIFSQSSDSYKRGSKWEGFDETSLHSNSIPVPTPSSGVPEQDFGADLSAAMKWTKNLPHKTFFLHGVQSRLFGLQLPRNIVSAMCQFMLKNLYQTDHPHDVDLKKKLTAFKVLPYLERFVHQNPNDASIVWNTLCTAMQNAMAAVQQFDLDDMRESERSTYQQVVGSLISACIRTRALPVIPAIETLHATTPVELMPENLAPLETLIQRINEEETIAVDTRAFYELYRDFQL